MEKVIKAVRSRTFWTIVALFLLAGFEGIRDVVPASLEVYVAGAISLLAVYFKVTPSQEY